MSVRGEQPLPGGTEKLLMATKGSAHRAASWFSYTAVSVTRTTDGRLWVTRTILDPGTRRVAPETLDSYKLSEAPGQLTDHELIRWWGHELVLRDFNGDWG